VAGQALVDLRSDTVTRPDRAMREAMAGAEVGDDVYGEDPTVSALEEEVAGLFGKPAGLFVPSGTMGNQICVRLLVEPGGELLCDADAHVVTYESAGAARHGGVQTRTVPAPRGLLDVTLAGPQVRPDGYFLTPTRAVAVENSHNRGGGAVYPLATLTELREFTRARGVALHCDGARIWNAHVATGVGLADYGACFDTLSVCLSKGLGAPVGSVVVLSDAAMLPAARSLRRALGGGMRQAGVLAAAGRHALAHNLGRLALDHANARMIGTRVAEAAPGVTEPVQIETNIVTLDLSAHRLDASELAGRCRESRVLVSVFGPRRVRLVTHLDVSESDARRAADVIAAALAA
jgi:threonine aldolase